MVDNAQISPQDERIFSALSHFLGLIAALIVWATQKDRSPYVRFQSLQALVFDALVYILTFIFSGCIALSTFAVALLGTTGSIFATEINQDPGPIIGIVIGIAFSLPFLVMLPLAFFAILVFILRIAATISTFQGKDFRYPLIGRWVEIRLTQD